MKTLSEKTEKKDGWRRWAALISAAIYTISPVDFIPDVPGIGWVDDGIVDALAIAYAFYQWRQDRKSPDIRVVTTPPVTEMLSARMSANQAAPYISPSYPLQTRSNFMQHFDPTDERRPLFDWSIFVLIHAIVIGGLSFVGYKVYGPKLGVWVGISAAIAGLTSTYLFAKIVPGETMMKVVLGLAVAANAGYLVHNGAQSMGIEVYNAAQIKKFEIGMAQAAQSGTRSVARILGQNAKEASALEKMFGDSVSVIAALLAFLELALAMMFFALASKRVAAVKRLVRVQEEFPQMLEVGK